MMRILSWLRLATLILVVMSVQKAALAAGEVTVAGYTNGCFCLAPPDTSELQTDGRYTNSVFNGTTLNNFLPLGGPPAEPPARNMNNLGSFAPSNQGGGFTLRVTFTEPPGIIGSTSVLIPAQINGPFVDFDNTPRAFNFTYLNADGSRTSGSFTVRVNDVFVDDSQGTVGLTGSIVGIQSTLPYLLISEFRQRGPGGATDEFVELYNNTDAPIIVATTDGSAGWALVSADDTTTPKFVIPTGRSIPARGHYLLANSGGYSLTAYPSGNNGSMATTATPDDTFTTDIPDNRGIAIFRTSNPANFTAAEKLDAVGPASEGNALYREGTGLPDLNPPGLQYSWVRRLPGGCTGSMPGFINHNCTTPALIQNTPAPTSGVPQDTENNVTDFIFLNTLGLGTPNENQRLGAPGPENKTSPVVRGNPNGSGGINPTVIDPMQPSGLPPNRVRDQMPVTNGTFGTIDIRRKFTNNTGQPLTRLRFRIMDISTLPAPTGIADLRGLTSTDTTVTLTGGSMITARGTTLETPPAQPNAGAFNSTLSAGTVSLTQPLAAGASIDVRFVFGVEQNGKFRVFVIVEALP